MRCEVSIHCFAVWVGNSVLLIKRRQHTEPVGIEGGLERETGENYVMRNFVICIAHQIQFAR